MRSVVTAPYVLVLKKTSSSGKTTLAKALQSSLPEAWIRCGVDDFLRLAPLERTDLFPSMEEARPLLAGIHRAMAALARSGNRIIADVVLHDTWLAADFMEALSDIPSLWVAVRCPLIVAEERERSRERQSGLAKSQYDTVHAHVTHDVEVDTSRLTVDESARVVEAVLERSRAG